MNRYYFDIKVNDDHNSRDEEGDLFAHIEEAEQEALKTLCDLTTDRVKRKDVLAALHIDVRDDVGPVLSVGLKVERTRLN